MRLKNILKTFIKEIIDLKNNKMDKSILANFYGSQIAPSFTVTPGSNYSSVSGGVILCGDLLRLYWSATRKSNSGAGNITNETIATFQIQTQGYFSGYYTTTGVTGTTGHLGTVYVGGGSFSADGGTFTISVILTSIHAAEDTTNGYITLPVKLNLV